MKYILVLLSLLPFILSAQQTAPKLSGDIILRNQDEYQGLIHSDPSGYWLHIYERSGRGILGMPGRNLILEKYDTAMKQEFSYAYGENSMISVELVSVKDMLVWIVLEKTGSYKYSYFMIPIGLDGKEGKKQFLFDLDINKTIDIPYTYTRLSPDSSSVAFVAEMDANKKKRQTKVYAAVMNNKAEVLWDKMSTLKGNQKQYQILDYQLTRDNELLFVTKYFKDKKAKSEVKNKRGETEAGYVIDLMTMGPNHKIPQKQTIYKEGTFFHDVTFEAYASGGVNVAGLISEESGGNISGVFFAQFDADQNPVISKTDKFTMSELIGLDKANVDVNLRKKNNQGLDDEFELYDMIRLADGSVVITAEENFVRSYTENYRVGSIYNTFGNRAGRNESVYLNSHDIVTIKLSSNGTVEGLQLIPKKQAHLMYQGRMFFNPNPQLLRETDLYLSHSNMVLDDKVLIFYNDDRNNFDNPDRKNRRRIENTETMETAMATLYDTLDYDLESFFGEDSRFLISPRRSKQIGSNKFFITLVPQRDRRQQNIRIGVLTF